MVQAPIDPESIARYDVYVHPNGKEEFHQFAAEDVALVLTLVSKCIFKGEDVHVECFTKGNLYDRYLETNADEPSNT